MWTEEAEKGWPVLNHRLITRFTTQQKITKTLQRTKRMPVYRLSRAVSTSEPEQNHVHFRKSFPSTGPSAVSD